MKTLPLEIYDQHINLVKYYARRCVVRFGAPADFWPDLIQEGCVGMIRAWQSYDPTKSKFATYSTPWIQLYQARYVRENISIVRPTRYNAGLSSKQIAALMARDLSLATPVTNTSVIGDLIPDSSEPVDDRLARLELRHIVREVACSFDWTEPERIVLERRILAWPEDQLTCREIGERFGQATSTCTMREQRMVGMIQRRLKQLYENLEKSVK